MTYIKLYRELLDSQCFAHPTTLKIWIWLLVKAKYKSCFIPLKVGKGFTEVEVKRGQLLFGRIKAEEELEIDGSTVYRHLQKLQEWEQIILEPNNQYTIITICNYESYQGDEATNEQPTNNQRTTNEQPTNNQRTQYKESKEGIESKEIKKTHTQGRNEIEMKNNYSGLEQVGKTFKLNIQQVHKYLEQFISEQRAADNFEHRDFGDLKKHFANWLKKEMEKEKKTEPQKAIYKKDNLKTAAELYPEMR